MAAEMQHEDEPRWQRAGPPYQFTREELQEELASFGFEITARQIRSWVSYGLIPRPIQQVPPLAPDGVARALYPAWVLFVLWRLLDKHRQGATIAQLKEIAPELIEHYQDNPRYNALEGWPPTTTIELPTAKATWEAIPPTVSRTATDRGEVTEHAAVTASVSVTATGTVWPRIPRALRRAVWDYVQKVSERNQLDESVQHVTITIQTPTVTLETFIPPSSANQSRGS